jgi:FkbM family methyltransferase
MTIVKKILKTLNRKRQAKKLGINFSRASSWKLPDIILLHNKRVGIKGPADIGTGIAFLDIFLDDCYGLRKLNRDKVKTILDIGAHAGFFSLFSRSLFPDAIIHCYEPNPEMGDYLRQQSLTGNFSFFPEAVGLKQGKIKLEIHEDSVQTKSLESDSGDIAMVPFKECIERLGKPVDILKLDCEGAEWEILKEDIKVWKTIAYLCMEYHLTGHHTMEEIKSLVSGKGFEIIRHEITGATWGIIHAKRKNERNF